MPERGIGLWGRVRGRPPPAETSRSRAVSNEVSLHRRARGGPDLPSLCAERRGSPSSIKEIPEQAPRPRCITQRIPWPFLFRRQIPQSPAATANPCSTRRCRRASVMVRSQNQPDLIWKFLVFLEAKSRKGAFSEIAGANSIILLTRFCCCTVGLNLNRSNSYL